MVAFSDLTQVMQNARTDAKTLDEYVHGAADTQVTSRLGKQYWTLATLDNKLSLVKIKAETTLADIDTLAKSATDSITAKSNSATTTIDNNVAQANSDISAKVANANTAIDSKVAAIDTRANSEIANLQSAINTAAAAGVGANGWTDVLIALSNGRNQSDKNSDIINVNDFGASKTAKLSSKYTTLLDAKNAYSNIASSITTLDQSLFWAALQSSVLSLSASGGGEIRISRGNWLLSDPIYGANNVTIVGTGDSCIITAEVNTRWNGKHIFYAQDCDNFFIKYLKIDQNGRSRSYTHATGASLVINKSKNSGAYDVMFHDASDTKSQSSTPQVLIIAKDVADDLTDFQALIGGVDGAKINKCRFSMPDKNTRCGFAIRLLTDFLKMRSRDSFVNAIKNCDISDNEFDGDYFWNHVELAGGGTKFNDISRNRFTGSGLTAVDFDKGCNYNTASFNTVENWAFPANQVSNSNVRLALFNDHGSDPDYRNIGNKMLYNTMRNIVGRNDYDTESLLSVQNVDSALFGGNIAENLNNGNKGSGIVIDNYAHNVTFINNNLKNVGQGVQSASTLSNASNIKFIDNDIIANRGSYILAAIANAKISGVVIRGGSAKSLSTSLSNLTFASNSGINDLTIKDINISGGVDGIAASADKTTIDNVNINNAAGRSIRCIGGKTTITNSNSISPILGDLIVNSGVALPTLHGNNFDATTTYKNPTISFANALPTTGTYLNGDTIYNNSPAANGFVGWICTIAGTLGTLSNVTANTTASSSTITVNSPTSLKVGDYLNITGDGSANRRIVAISGTTITLSSNVSATLTAATVNYGQPIFKTFGAISA